MKEIINLTNELFIASGGERNVYQHPLDSSKVIKILYKKDGIYAYGGSRNKIEHKYFRFLEKSKIPFTHISRCYNYLDTNLGKGLVYDKVCDYDGKLSRSFLKVIRKRLLKEDEENLLINEFKEYIFKYNILFIDCELHNIFCCEYEKEKYRLIIIDGLGAKRKGFKFWLYLHSKIYTKYKVKSQWKIFVRNINIELLKRKNKELILKDENFIGKGLERACYNHPEDKTKVIKIIYSKQGIINNQNYVEYVYINYLKKQKKDLSMIACCYDYVDTNLGKGLIFDKVLNYDETLSSSFRDLIMNRVITFAEQKVLLNELKEYLEDNEILFIDNTLKNIFCKEIEKGKYKLIIIDGLGAKRKGIKFWLYLHSRNYTKYKIKKQWAKFMNIYKKCLKKTNDKMFNE